MSKIDIFGNVFGAYVNKFVVHQKPPIARYNYLLNIYQYFVIMETCAVVLTDCCFLWEINTMSLQVDHCLQLFKDWDFYRWMFSGRGKYTQLHFELRIYLESLLYNIAITAIITDNYRLIFLLKNTRGFVCEQIQLPHKNSKR